MSNYFRAALCFLALNTIPSTAPAESLPLWEAGAGVGVIDFPDYRGSAKRRTYVLPVPYLVYRGEILKVDRESVRSRLFTSRDVKLDLSVNGSPPVKSNDNPARQGMPNLDPIFEAGPALNVSLARSTDDKYKLDFRLPVRPAFTTDFSYVKSVGWIAQPLLALDIANPFGGTKSNLGLQGGPIYTDRRYNNHFYGVDAAFATPERPAYTARGGYAGNQFIVALSRRYPNYWIGGFIKWDTLNGAVFEDSPLVKKKQLFSAGFAMSWIFDVSKTQVEIRD